jgi:4-hydroxybutyryl-CoA dehydratase/vinylacetyl-CoA-Delta-isomerase
VCKQNITRFPYEIVRLAEDLASQLTVTLPFQKGIQSDLAAGKAGETIY